MKYLRLPIAFKMAGKLYAHNCLLPPNMPNILNVTHLPYISLSLLLSLIHKHSQSLGLAMAQNGFIDDLEQRDQNPGSWSLKASLKVLGRFVYHLEKKLCFYFVWLYRYVRTDHKSLVFLLTFWFVFEERFIIVLAHQYAVDLFISSILKKGKVWTPKTIMYRGIAMRGWALCNLKPWCWGW
jgi:hypothetical protein